MNNISRAAHSAGGTHSQTQTPALFEDELGDTPRTHDAAAVPEVDHGDGATAPRRIDHNPLYDPEEGDSEVVAEFKRSMAYDDPLHDSGWDEEDYVEEDSAIPTSGPDQPPAAVADDLNAAVSVVAPAEGEDPTDEETPRPTPIGEPSDPDAVVEAFDVEGRGDDPLPLARLRLELAPREGRGKRRTLFALLATDDAAAGKEIYRDLIDPDDRRVRLRAAANIAAAYGLNDESQEVSEIERMIRDAADAADEREENEEEAPARKESDRVIAATRPAIDEFVRTEAGDQFAQVQLKTGGPEAPTRREAMRLDGHTFELFVRQQVFDRLRTGVSEAALSQAIGQFQAEALFRGTPADVWVRSAWGTWEGQDAVFYDYGDPTGQCAVITADEVRTAETPKVRFSRSPGQAPLPRPKLGGTVGKLRDYLNVDEQGLRTVCAFLTMAATPKGHPFPGLIVNGPQGAGKSSSAAAIVNLVDPQGTPLQKFPKDPDDLWLSAASRRLLALDNIRRIRWAWSDDIARMLTGGTMEKRRHYSNGRLYSVDAQNPILLVGIGAIVDEPDLLDRCVGLRMNRIPASGRLSDAKAAAAFADLRAETLGLIFDGLRLWLQARRDGTLLEENLPRMADFAQVAHAAAPAFGFRPDEVLAVLSESLQEIEAEALEAYPAVSAIAEEVLGRGSAFYKQRIGASDDYTVRISPDTLFHKLGDLCRPSRGPGMPPNPSELSKQLFRCEGPLKRRGVTVESRRPGHRRELVFRVEEWAKADRERVPVPADASGLGTAPQDVVAVESSQAPA